MAAAGVSFYKKHIIPWQISPYLVLSLCISRYSALLTGLFFRFSLHFFCWSRAFAFCSSETSCLLLGVTHRRRLAAEVGRSISSTVVGCKMMCWLWFKMDLRAATSGCKREMKWLSSIFTVYREPAHIRRTKERISGTRNCESWQPLVNNCWGTVMAAWALPLSKPSITNFQRC